VTVHITVQENGDKKRLNNPGGDEMMPPLAGLPYFAFLAPDGKTLATSMEPGHDGKKDENIGFPDAPHEVDWFLEMLARAIPQMQPAEKSTVETYLRKPKK
jgi:hypothetical protein